MKQVFSSAGLFTALALVIALAVSSDRAMAQSASQSIQITATVGNACAINGNSSSSDTATIPIDATGNVVVGTITPLNSPYANVSCNAPSTLQLKSLQGGVKNSTSPSSGYTNIIDYQATATWNGVTASIDTTSTAGATGAEIGTAKIVSAGSGSLAVTISPIANTQPLESGVYSDTLVVLLTPQ
jgi:hypothetical protein